MDSGSNRVKSNISTNNNNSSKKNNFSSLPVIFKSQGKVSQQDIAIFCDPKYPIKWLESLLEKSKKAFSSSLSIHTHSSVTKLPKELENYYCNIENNSEAIVKIVFIWKNIGIDPILKFNCHDDIFGAINIARYLNRLIESVDISVLKYESKGSAYASEIDMTLDKIHNLLHKEKSVKEISALLGKTKVALLHEFSIVDIILEAL